MSKTIIRDNLQLIRHRIEETCRECGRKPAEVEVMAVCKGQDAKTIRTVYECGLHLLGENRQQEGETHMQSLAGLDIRWHFIGRLQKNKINRILTQYQFIQSVDSIKVLEHIHKRVEKPLDVFIEINIGEEKNKAGFTVDGLKKALTYIAQLNRVRITGLMAMPPFLEEVEATRPYFSRLRELRDGIARLHIANIPVHHLSMGMSRDYPLAVAEGATLVRIGSALFGPRRPS